MPMTKKEKGTLIALAVAGGILGLLAYMFLQSSKPATTKPVCSMTKRVDGTTEIFCRFAGDIGADLMVDLLGTRQILSVTGNLILTGIGKSGVVRPYNELRWAFAPFVDESVQNMRSPPYYSECQNATPGMVCSFQRTFPNVSAQKIYFRGMGSTAPFANPLVSRMVRSIIEPSSLKDFELRIIVR